MSPYEKKIKRVQARVKRNILRESAFNGNFEVVSLFGTEEDLK